MIIKQRVNCIAFNKDCEVLVSGSYDRTVKVWDMRSNNYRPMQTMDDFGDSVSSIYVSKEEIVTGCVDGCARTYDIRKGKLIVDNIGRMCI
jgi:mitogen-activated protein kinase organizer 1